MAKYQVGDLVMFRKRTQNCECGMKVAEVDEAPLLGDARYRLQNEYVWWSEGNLMPHSEWHRRYRQEIKWSR